LTRPIIRRRKLFPRLLRYARAIGRKINVTLVEVDPVKA
jgi:hypothetical protein